MIPSNKLYLIFSVMALCVHGRMDPWKCSEATLGCSLVDLLPIPICASDGKTYTGQCALMKANCRLQLLAWSGASIKHSIKHLGSCPRNPICDLEKDVGPCRQVFQLNDFIRKLSI